MPDEDFRKHLDLIQGVINRLAGNSFSVKTWAVGLITVLGALAAKDADARISVALLLPALCFWWLDAYYLRQERLYRELYTKTVAGDTLAPRYSLNASPFESQVDGILKTAFSSTVGALHLPILVFVIGLIVYSLTPLSKRPAGPPTLAPGAATQRK
jgi:hypothetical protein